jgi:hypothetical protein
MHWAEKRSASGVLVVEARTSPRSMIVSERDAQARAPLMRAPGFKEMRMLRQHAARQPNDSAKLRGTVGAPQARRSVTVSFSALFGH